MSYLKSARGFVSTNNSTNSLLGGAATYTGTWEDVTNYASITIIANADVAGTLYVDFSSDSSNVDRTVQLSETDSTNLGIHSLIVVARYFRVRVINGASPQGVFRLQSILHTISKIAQPTSRMRQTLGGYSDVLNTRAVSVGAVPDGTFKNIQADGLGFQTSTLLTNGQTYDSGVLSLEGYTQVQTHVLSDVVGTITIDFIRDSGGTDVLRTLTIPYSSGTYETFAAPAFTPYVRYRFTCDAAGQTDFYFDTKFITKSINGQILGLDSFISPLMVANLGRNIIVGKDGGGTFNNVNTVETTNNAGTFHSLQVVSGARPSQLYGRTSVNVSMDSVSASSSLRTVTGSRDYYVTDIILTIENSDTANSGSIKFEDGSGGTLKLPILVEEARTNETSVTTLTQSFNEPLVFTSEVYLTIVSGTLNVSGVFLGYEE